MDFLIIKNLSKKYNDQIVLDKVNLSFPSKGLFFLLGESGGGKSTFINCLCGIEKMDRLKMKEHRILMDLITGWTMKCFIIKNLFI